MQKETYQTHLLYVINLIPLRLIPPGLTLAVLNETEKSAFLVSKGGWTGHSLSHQILIDPHLSPPLENGEYSMDLRFHCHQHR